MSDKKNQILEELTKDPKFSGLTKRSKGKKRNNKISQWSILINSNTTLSQMNSAEETKSFILKFNNVIKEVLRDNLPLREKIMNIKDPSKIYDVKLIYDIEIGSRNDIDSEKKSLDFIHSHGIITVIHDTYVQLNYKLIPKEIEKRMGIKKQIFFDARLIKNNNEHALIYATKGLELPHE